MSATDHINQYSAADIQRYLEGKMLPAEMHDLEKAALDDPFLADAIEGMQQTLAEHDVSVIDTHLESIGKKVAERTQKEDSSRAVAPIRAFRWWQVAAAAVVVVIGGIWAYDYLGRSSEKDVAQQIAVVQHETAQKSVTPAPVADSVAVLKLADSLANTESYAFSPNDKHTQENQALLAEKPLADLRNKPAEAKSRAVSEPAAVHDDLQYKYKANTLTLQDGKQVTLDAPSASRVDSLLKKIPGVQVTQDGNVTRQTDNFNRKAYYNSLDKTYKSKPGEYEQIVVAKKNRDTTSFNFYSKPMEMAMNRSRKELSEKQAKKNPDALLSGFVSGRVTDQANNPLSNALLRLEDNRYFYTDQQGQFKIPANDSIVNVAVGVTGYYTQNLQLYNNTRNNNISLNQLGVKAPNPQLNESVQVRGVSNHFDTGNSEAKYVKRREINYPEVLVQDAQPEYGWVEFQQYLDKNKQTPPGNPELKGTVAVSFMVNKKGTLSDFKIEQSLDKMYDDEALRLIKAGPSWKLNRGRKAKVTVLVRF